MYPNLKLQIFKKGIRQNQLARVLGMNEAALSKIINGYHAPSESHRRMLAGYLEAEEAWLFERFEVPPQQETKDHANRSPEWPDGKS